LRLKANKMQPLECQNPIALGSREKELNAEAQRNSEVRGGKKCVIRSSFMSTFP
jgi:hypothetical protein